MKDALPIIDISGLSSPDLTERAALAEGLGRACRDTGFFYVTGHGVPAGTMQALFDASRRFFALPAEDLSLIHI